VKKFILGKKLKMTQIFEGDNLVPVSVIQAGPCKVVQKKTEERDGYNAIQIGFEEIEENKLNKPEQGHFRKNNIPPLRYLREIKLEDISKIAAGETIEVNIFKKGDLVNIRGISKGKGFQGVVKRHGFRGGPASHGAKQWHRRPGSIGASSDPSRVFKGKEMPGRMGRERVTIRNLRVVDVDTEENLLLVKGSIPGSKGSLLLIEEA